MYEYEENHDYVMINGDDTKFVFPIRDPHWKEVFRWIDHHENTFQKFSDTDSEISMEDIDADDIEVIISTVKEFTFVPDHVVDDLRPTDLFEMFSETIESISEDVPSADN